MTSAAGAGNASIRISARFLAGDVLPVRRNYFVIVFFNVALVGGRQSRCMGGTWNVRDGLELAWARKARFLQWALRRRNGWRPPAYLEERMGIIGRRRHAHHRRRLDAGLLLRRSRAGLRGPLADPSREASSKLFRDTWGEKVMADFSLSLVSLVLMLPGIGLWFRGNGSRRE